MGGGSKISSIVGWVGLHKQKQKQVKMDTTTTSLYAKSIGDSNLFDLMAIVHPPSQSTKTGHDICLVIDVSGSTNSAASPELANMGEDDGMSILDIVKLATNTIITAVDSNTTVSIVPFSSQGNIALRSTKMNADGKAAALCATTRLVSAGTTNLWDGIKLGMESLPEPDPNRTSTVLVLTDGLPNTHPTKGYIPTLQQFRDTHGSNTTLHTFGFGYSLDSELLESLSLEAHGSFFYIPDANYVGTTFINALSSILCTEAGDVQLSWEFGEGVRVATDCDYTLPYTRTSWGVQQTVGVLQAGQPRNIVFRVENTKGLPLEQLATVTADRGTTMIPIQGVTGEEDIMASHINRQIMVTQTRNAATHATGGNYALAQSIVVQMIESMHHMTDSLVYDAATLRLIEDISGQVTQAVSSRDFFGKWGKHYLRSLIRAHEVQQCINFKDPGIQHYGGTAFRAFRDMIETVFDALPPPVPSRRTTSSSSSTSSSVNIGRNYYNNSAPCAKGNCPVRMADNSLKPISQLRKGDTVRCADSSELAQITCVVQTRVPKKQYLLVSLSNTVSTTPWHPIQIREDADSDAKWVFPNDVREPSMQPCRNLYSIVAHKIDGSICPAIWLDKIVFITLAHGLDGNNVVNHPFLGTSAVSDALKQHSGWTTGKIVFPNTNCMHRDSSGRACGFGASE